MTGYKRSGTTLLGNIIDRHPSIAVFVESFFIPRYYYTQVMFWPLENDRNFLRLAESIGDEVSAKANQLQVARERVLASGSRTLPGLVDTLLGHWAHARGKQRWADKSPGYITRFRVLQRMFPDARFVHIVRDGRDVWLSLKKLGWETDAVKVASDWSRSVTWARRYARRHLAERYIEVQYERLVTHPEEETRRISAFLGEPYVSAMIEPDRGGPGNPALVGWPKVDRAIDAANTCKWKDRLDDHERAAFDVCAATLLTSLGYEVSEHRQPAGRRLAIRIRQAGNRAKRPWDLARRGSQHFARALARRFA